MTRHPLAKETALEEGGGPRRCGAVPWFDEDGEMKWRRAAEAAEGLEPNGLPRDPPF